MICHSLLRLLLMHPIFYFYKQCYDKYPCIMSFSTYHLRANFWKCSSWDNKYTAFHILIHSQVALQKYWTNAYGDNRARKCTFPHFFCHGWDFLLLWSLSVMQYPTTVLTWVSLVNSEFKYLFLCLLIIYILCELPLHSFNYLSIKNILCCNYVLSDCHLFFNLVYGCSFSLYL